jgi:Fungal specific transcription factor domain
MVTDVDAHPDKTTELTRPIRSNRVRAKLPEDAMTEVFTWLQNTALQASNPSYKKSESFIVRRKIQGYLNSNPEKENSETEKNDSGRAWLLASMIYLHTIIATPEELERLQETERELVLQLKRSLKRLIAATEGFGVPCSVLLWILMIGCVCSEQRDKNWFRERIRTTMATAELESWPDVRLFLKDLPWVQSGIDEWLRELCFGGREGR